jgi:geranylgeranyl diphosphate synthase type II
MYSVKELQQIISIEIEKQAVLLGKTKPGNLYQPLEYILRMKGKRFRPALILLVYNLFKEDIQTALPAAVGIEFFHNFTLLHDDIMDNANVRRNNPSVHAKYNHATAILSGDALSILAHQYFLKLTSPNILEILSLFLQTAVEVCEGQQYDIDFEDRIDVTQNEYLEMTRLKTAVLLACCAKIGALLGEGSAKDTQHLYDFGMYLGMSFQLQDDLLDAYGDFSTFGKCIGKDIVANKKTFLLIHALEKANPAQRRILESWLLKKTCNEEEKIAVVKNIFDQINVKSYTETKIERYYQKAMDCLKKISIAAEKKHSIKNFVHMLMRRSQ